MKLKATALAVLALASFSFVAAPAGADEVIDAYQQSNAAIKGGDLDEGARLMKVAFEKAMEVDHPQKAVLGLNAGILFNKVEKWEEASGVLEATLELYKAQHGADSDKLEPVLDQLQAAYVRTQNTEKGIPLLDTRIAIATKKFGADSDEVFAAELDKLAARAFDGEYRGAQRDLRAKLRELEDAGKDRSLRAGQIWLRLAATEFANPTPGLSTAENFGKYTKRGEEILEEVLPVGDAKLIAHYRARIEGLERFAANSPRLARDKRELEEKLEKNLAVAKKNEGATAD